MLNAKDLAAGALVAVVGLLFCIATLASLPIGSAAEMGSGYFPLILGGILICLGIIIAIQQAEPAHDTTAPIPWRGLLLTTSAAVVFGVTQQGLGLLPSLVLAILLSAFASQKMTIKLAFMLAATLTIVCTAIFKYGLSMPLNLLGNWILT